MRNVTGSLILYNKFPLILHSQDFFWPAVQISARLFKGTYFPDLNHEQLSEVSDHLSSPYSQTNGYGAAVLGNKNLYQKVEDDGSTALAFRSSVIYFEGQVEITARYIIVYISDGGWSGSLVGYIDFEQDYSFDGDSIRWIPDPTYGWFHIFKSIDGICTI